CVIIDYEDLSASSWREGRQLDAGRRHFCRRQIHSRSDSVHPEIQPFHILPISRMDTKPMNWNQTTCRKGTLWELSRKKIFVPRFRTRVRIPTNLACSQISPEQPCTCVASSAEPFQGSASLILQPRVARSSQPWTGGRNPFRIAD